MPAARSLVAPPSAARLCAPLLLALLAIPAAATTPPATAPEGFNPHRMTFKPGAYRCELGRSVQVKNVSGDMQTATIRWNNREHLLRAVGARSGALRYEDPASGLVWLMIPGKSMLLDAKQGQRLADECRS